MDKQTLDLQQALAGARFQDRTFGTEFAQDRWMDVLAQLEKLGMSDARQGIERDMSRFEIDPRPYHEAFREQREAMQGVLAWRLEEAEKATGKTLEGKEAQAGERYNGPLMYADKDYLAQLNEKDNTLVLHDRSRIANGTEWAAEGKQAEISYSPGGTGIAKEHENTLEHQGREVARDHETSREASLEHGR